METKDEVKATVGEWVRNLEPKEHSTPREHRGQYIDGRKVLHSQEITLKKQKEISSVPKLQPVRQ